MDNDGYEECPDICELCGAECNGLNFTIYGGVCENCLLEIENPIDDDLDESVKVK
jgi:hypothetical protein